MWKSLTPLFLLFHYLEIQNKAQIGRHAAVRNTEHIGVRVQIDFLDLDKISWIELEFKIHRRGEMVNTIGMNGINCQLLISRLGHIIIHLFHAKKQKKEEWQKNKKRRNDRWKKNCERQLLGSNPSGGMGIYIWKYIEQFKIQNAKVVLLKTSIRTSLPLYTSERVFLSIL